MSKVTGIPFIELLHRISPRLRRPDHIIVRRRAASMPAKLSNRAHFMKMKTKSVTGAASRMGKAHILVRLIPYPVWKTLQQWQSRVGLGPIPRTIPSRIHAVDIVLRIANAKKGS
jgi:hypothetical protein